MQWGDHCFLGALSGRIRGEHWVGRIRGKHGVQGMLTEYRHYILRDLGAGRIRGEQCVSVSEEKAGTGGSEESTCFADAQGSMEGKGRTAFF